MVDEGRIPFCSNCRHRVQVGRFGLMVCGLDTSEQHPLRGLYVAAYHSCPFHEFKSREIRWLKTQRLAVWIALGAAWPLAQLGWEWPYIALTKRYLHLIAAPLVVELCDDCNERPATETWDYDGYLPADSFCERCAEKRRDRWLENNG